MISELYYKNSKADSTKEIHAAYLIGLAFISGHPEFGKDFSAGEKWLHIAVKNGHEEAACELIHLYQSDSLFATDDQRKWVDSQPAQKLKDWRAIAFAVVPACNRNLQIR